MNWSGPDGGYRWVRKGVNLEVDSLVLLTRQAKCRSSRRSRMKWLEIA